MRQRPKYYLYKVYIKDHNGNIVDTIEVTAEAGVMAEDLGYTIWLERMKRSHYAVVNLHDIKEVR